MFYWIILVLLNLSVNDDVVDLLPIKLDHHGLICFLFLQNQCKQPCRKLDPPIQMHNLTKC